MFVWQNSLIWFGNRSGALTAPMSETDGTFCLLRSWILQIPIPFHSCWSSSMRIREFLHHSFKQSLCFAHSVLQAWAPWRMGPVATTTASASTALMALTEAASSCVCSSWLLWRTTQRSTTSRCSAGKNADLHYSLKKLQIIQNNCCCCG